MTAGRKRRLTLPPLEDPFDAAMQQRLVQAIGDRSLRAVGADTGTPQETVRRGICQGRPSVRFLAQVCTAYGVSAEWLLRGEGLMHHHEAHRWHLDRVETSVIAAVLGLRISRIEQRTSGQAVIESKAPAREEQMREVTGP